jgi:hypothetical protein
LAAERLVIWSLLDIAEAGTLRIVWRVANGDVAVVLCATAGDVDVLALDSVVVVLGLGGDGVVVPGLGGGDGGVLLDEDADPNCNARRKRVGQARLLYACSGSSRRISATIESERHRGGGGRLG